MQHDSTHLKNRILEQFIKPGSQRRERELASAVGLNYYEPSDLASLQSALDPLVEDGTLKRTYRVLTPFDNRNGLEDFDRREDIPAEMVDEWRDPPEPFTVTDDDVVVVYELLVDVHGALDGPEIPKEADASLIRQAADTIALAAEMCVKEGLFDEEEAEGDHSLVIQLRALADRMVTAAAPHPHCSQTFTPEVLERLAKDALEHDDLEFHDICRRALTDVEALRTAAVLLQSEWVLPPRDEVLDEISPKVRPLVIALASCGFHTTDSGDGSNWKAGMKCALPYRHVTVQIAPWQDIEAEAERVRRCLAWFGYDDEYGVEAVEATDDLPGVILVEDRRAHAICREVGYESPSIEDLMGET